MIDHTTCNTGVDYSKCCAATTTMNMTCAGFPDSSVSAFAYAKVNTEAAMYKAQLKVATRKIIHLEKKKKISPTNPNLGECYQGCKK